MSYFPMPKPARLARIAHTKQKPKPRLVTKAHLLEQRESESASKAARRSNERAEQQQKRSKRR
jgi:hypothetical protein